MFTIEHSDFLSEFYDCTKNYTYSTFDEINYSILHDVQHFYSHFFNEEEIATIIVLNKAFFQNITGFIKLIEMKLPLPAFNSLRAAIEALRLFRAFFIDDEFRKEYIQNKNTDFRNTSDYSFMQNKINKVLDKKEKELRSQEKIPFSMILSNHKLVQGSAISELHSELSKWSHLLNINLLMSTHLNKGEIYLGLDDELNTHMQQVLKKYVEGVSHLVSYHSETFCTVSFRKEYYDISLKMINMYSKYIELFY